MIIFSNEEQFKNIYLQKAPVLISFARRYVSNLMAEDIVHDVFVKLWREQISLSVDKGADTYLFRMVQNACLDYLKHKTIEENFARKTFLEIKIEELKWSDTPERFHDTNIRLKDIYTAIDELPPKCREIFTKAYIYEEKNADIASYYQISVRTVEAQIYKALKLIRDALTTILIVSFSFF